MKHAVRIAIAVVAVVLVASGARAQTRQIGTFNIDFAFTAAGKAMPAGAYRFEASDVGTSVTITSGAASANLVVVTRLGRHDNDKDIELVFDKVKDQVMLSEIWPAAGSDGYLVLANTAAHTHVVMGGSKPSPKP
jgi:hypothetical protein